MSAYVIVEANVRDKAARERYSSQVGPILRKFEGEILAALRLSFGGVTHLSERGVEYHETARLP